MSDRGPADRLQQARAREAARLQAAAQISSEVAHELNNLITVVMGNGELLQDALTDQPALRALADLIVLAADRSAELSANLLGFARRHQPRPRPVAINDFLRDLLPLLQAKVGDDIDVCSDPDPDAWPVLVDPDLLESALIALSANACAALQGCGPLRRITISTRNSHDAALTGPGLDLGGHLQMMIADTGCGMSRETRLRATDLFFSGQDDRPAPRTSDSDAAGDRPGSGEGGGEGLSLSLVHSFIKQSNGLMAIDSAPGKGTSIRLWLPRAMPVPAK